jgi:glycosyltransferase involved in cell wall biosynthesis
MSSSHRVCVICPNRDVYSETFIHNHIEKLPAHVHKLYGGWFPMRRPDDTRLLPLPLFAAEKFKHALPARLGSLHVCTRDRFLARHLRSQSIDVVLAEYGPTGVSIMDACRRARIPFVVHFHGFDAHDTATLETYGRSYPVMFSRAAAVVAVSRYMEKQLIEIGRLPEKVHYLPYGVDCSVFEGANPAAAPAVFLAVGRFVDKKAPYLTLVAFQKTLLRVPDARLVFIGDGELLEACKQLACALQVSRNVDFRKPQPSAAVATAMRSSRAFVQHSIQTSYGDSEGTPVGILEAGAAGLPVVSTRHAGIKDVVLEGKTGFLVDEGDVDRMADHMIALAENPSLAGALGAKARQHIASNFALMQNIDRLWNILLLAIKAGRS